MAVITVLVCVGVVGAMVAAGCVPLVIGLREGDRAGDVTVASVRTDQTEVCFTVYNRGDQAVIVGASLRRRSLRLRCEGPAFVSVPRRTARDALLAGRHAVVCAIAAGEIATVRVPPHASLPARAELMVAVGQTDRLRVIHRAVALPASTRSSQAPRPSQTVQARTSGSSSAYLPPESSVPCSG